MQQERLPVSYYVLMIVGFVLLMSVVLSPVGAACWYLAYRMDENRKRPTPAAA